MATGAALRIDDADLNPDTLYEAVSRTLGDDAELARMRTALEETGAGNVAEEIARRIAEAAGK